MQENDNVRGAETFETREMGIAGMTCDHCARRVETALRGVTGVKDVRVERAAARAVITFDPARTNVPALHDAVSRAGYEPTATRPG